MPNGIHEEVVEEIRIQSRVVRLTMSIKQWETGKIKVQVDDVQFHMFKEQYNRPLHGRVTIWFKPVDPPPDESVI